MSDLDTTPAPTPPPSPRQVMLGGFILFQLAFLITANLLGFGLWVPSRTTDQSRKILRQAAPDVVGKHGHGWEWGTQVETNVRRWTQLTLQDQEWSLFAPTVGKATGFPCVLLVWANVDPEEPFPPGTQFEYDPKNGIHLSAPWNPPSDQDRPPGTEMLLSKNEPKNINSFMRINNCRVRRYEGQLFLNLQPNEDEEYDHLAARVTDLVRDLTKDYHDQTFAYLRWRLKEWTAANPNEPQPKQVILFERFYRILPPGEERGWQRALYPIARWQPDGPKAKAANVLEYFDFKDRQFYPAK